MDIAMPLLNGLEASRHIRQAAPATKVLVLSAHSDDAYVERATALGVAGCLLKHTSSHEPSQAIREVPKGNTFFSPAVAKRLHAQKPPVRNGRPKQQVAHMNSRELEVVQLSGEGEANTQIAAELGLSM